MKTRTKKILGFSFSLFFTVFLLELLLRIFSAALPPIVQMQSGTGGEIGKYARTYNSLFTFDKDLLTKLRDKRDVLIEGHPDYTYHVKTIELTDGLWVRDDGFSKVWGVAVGDSYVFGEGVAMKDTWVEVLEKSLRRDMINCGAPNWGFDQYYVLLKKYLVPLKPEVVLISIFENDFYDTLYYDQWINRLFIKKIQRFLNRHFLSYVVMKYFYFSLIKKQREYFFDKRYDQYFEINKSVDPSRIMKKTLSMLEKITVLAENKKIKLLFLLFPSKEMVYLQNDPEYRVYIMQKDQMFRRVRRMLTEKRISYIAFEKLFREYRSRKIYFRYDGHLTEYGNRLSACVISQKLRTMCK
ncbi:MAG: hypothetical protein JW827_00675 [Spirochaetes bacterium]|nr:hypothetical protein [Spirochaetota bacterium]